MAYGAIKPRRNPQPFGKRARKVNMQLTIERVPSERADRAFLACATVGKGNTLSRMKCAYGKNPRAATKKALSLLSTIVGLKHGAYAGQ